MKQRTPEASSKKKCPNCLRLKKIDNFYRTSGWCRTCLVNSCRRRRAENPEHYRALSRACTWRDRFRDRARELNLVATKRYASKNHHKRLAYGAVRRALKSGKLTKLPCQVCGRGDNLEAHHDSYSKPLEVRWFCKIHHKEYHRNATQGQDRQQPERISQAA